MEIPFRTRDLLLILVAMSSMGAAIIFPDFGSRFQAFPFYCLMVNFFLSYLSIDMASVWKALAGNSGRIIVFTAAKLVLFPVIIYYVFSLVAPNYALSALLLTGVSVGVISPMMSNMVKGNSALVLVVVVVTSALAPFTLPAVVKLAASQEMALSFSAMLKMLATVIFIPMIAVELIRFATPRLVRPIMHIHFPLFLVMIALINLGVFYQYASFFRQEPSAIVMALVVVFLCWRRSIAWREFSFSGQALLKINWLAPS